MQVQRCALHSGLRIRIPLINADIGALHLQEPCQRQTARPAANDGNSFVFDDHVQIPFDKEWNQNTATSA
ncbi:hypothetical protein GCM10011396_09280 [Undibacterium terreum]|uniref:Uncharacterized protein n=1 Tax=Undibacterium terreum TaxID=1224302 RepID=A0A916XEG5_9BURK|nr:hypothetical protein GCM10011396_09280 [Undibacterium terreum]